jgi:DNA-binding CsgD family transcriptional regulator/PAS domain-containing protein
MNCTDIQTALDITPHFYRAALDFRAWPNVLARLNAVFDAQVAQVTLGNYRNGDLLATAHSGLTPEMLEAWLACPDHVRTDPRIPHALRLPNRPLCERDMMSLTEWHGSPFYVNLFAPFGLDSSIGAFTLLDEEAGIFAAFGVVRSLEAPAFTQRDIERFHLYLPHFREAMRCAFFLQTAQAQGRSYANVFERLRVAALVTDRFGTLRYVNAAARMILKQKEALRLSHGVVAGATGQDTAALRKSIMRALAEGSSGLASRILVRLSRPTQASDLLISIAPVGSDEAFNVPGHQMLAVLFVLDPERRYEGDVEALQRLFGLTQVESEIMLRIARGQTPREAADELGRSYETVRSHLKTIYGKTGTRTQSALGGLAFAMAEP